MQETEHIVVEVLNVAVARDYNNQEQLQKTKHTHTHTVVLGRLVCVFSLVMSNQSSHAFLNAFSRDGSRSCQSIATVSCFVSCVVAPAGMTPKEEHGWGS